MKSRDRMPEDTAGLRRRAEEIAREKSARLPQNMEARSPEETRQVFHELRVHQIELEMQNEELRRAQAELDAVRARYFDLYDLAPVGYITINEKGLILEGNLTASGLLGVTRSALVNQPVTRFILKEDQDIYYLHRKHLFETGEPQACELRMLKKDETEFWAHLDATVAQDDNGAPVCRSTMSDITDHKRAEEELRESEEKYRTLFDSAGDAIFILDAEGRMLTVNQLACRWLGYTREELMSMSVNQVDSPEEALHAQERIALVMEEGYLAFETVCQRKDSSLFPAEVSSRRITWDGKPAIMSICRDITDRKRAEEEKAKLEAQLRQAQKLESVGKLAGGVAHDFNNMLGIILGYTELAMDQMDPAQKIFAYLHEIRKAAERSANLTRQLLAFARKQVITPRVLDLNETVESMFKMLERLIGEDINLVWLPGASVWPVRVDPHQIDQILANLCVNARDAITGVGKVTIETKISTLDEEYCAEHDGSVPGEYVLLAVSDDGCGMNGETLDKLFEPFFTTKETGKGTGLGLAMVYGIVKQNNGFIDIFSEPGRGTEIKIYLPRHKGKDDEASTEGLAEPALRGQETILLVEDEPAILEMIKRMLETQGYTVLAASIPAEAIRMAGEHSGEIRLLLTDVMMPEMNGLDLAKNLLSCCHHLKTLFMSGYTADIIAHQGVLDEEVYFIEKPFSMKELAARVREVLDKKAA